MKRLALFVTDTADISCHVIQACATGKLRSLAKPVLIIASAYRGTDLKTFAALLARLRGQGTIFKCDMVTVNPSRFKSFTKFQARITLECMRRRVDILVQCETSTLVLDSQRFSATTLERQRLMEAHFHIKTIKMLAEDRG